MLYRVKIGEDEYLGTAEEVVAFMARADGAPGSDPTTYMEGVARRIAEQLGIEGIATSDQTAFLDALDDHGVIRVETQDEPLRHRDGTIRDLGDGPVVLGPGVEPEDVEGT